MQTISAEEFKKKYGDDTYRSFIPPTEKEQKRNGYISRVKDKVKGVIQNSANQINDAISGEGEYRGQSIIRRSTGVVAGGFNAIAGIALGVPVQIAGEDLGNTKVMQNLVTNHPKVADQVEKMATTASDPIGALGNKIGGTQAAQGFVTNHPTLTKFLEETAGTLKNTGEIAGNILLADQGAKYTQKKVTETQNVVKDLYSKVKPNSPPPAPPGPSAGIPLGTTAKNFVKDVIPSMERGINHTVTKALDLTPGDVSNIRLSTGNEVGQFMAKKNLIGENVQTTKANLDNYYKQNYQTVRTEITKVKTPYKQNQVPRYVESLKALKSKVDEVPGLQKDSVEIENLLNKKQPTLSDVQRVKELVDKHSDLYKATGDVKAGIEKQGLDVVRKDLRKFIEQEVKKNTGTDIGELNNNVATSREILKAIKTRETAGLTKSMVNTGDYGTFIGATMATGNPFVGAASVFVKKLLQSPSVQLRIAKFLDGISDTRKAAIQEDLRQGKIPPEFNQFIKKK